MKTVLGKTVIKKTGQEYLIEINGAPHECTKEVFNLIMNISRERDEYKKIVDTINSYKS